MPTGRGGVRNSHFRLHNSLGIRVTTFSEQNVEVKTNNLSGLPANKMVSESLSQLTVKLSKSQRIVSIVSFVSR